MKKNLNITELVTALKDQQAQKYDAVVSAKRIRFTDGKLQILRADNDVKDLVDLATAGVDLPSAFMADTFTTLSTFEDQISEKLGIPRAYFRRMAEEGNLSLLDKNVNHWLSKSNDNYLVRSFLDLKNPDNCVARAFLSSSYKMIDNFDVLMTALDAVRLSGVQLEIDSCDITDKRMYVRFVAPSVEIQAKELLKNYRVPSTGASDDHGIIAGFVLSNSETGFGAFAITPRIVIKVCNNGAIAKRDALRKIHVGEKQEESEIKWNEDTEAKKGELIQLQIRDAVQTFVTAEYVGKAADYLLSQNKALDNPIDAVKNVTKVLQYDEQKSADILNYFVKSGDMTSFGVSQAVTFYAHQNADADDRFDMEGQAFEVVELANNNDKPFVDTKRKSMKGFSNN